MFQSFTKRQGNLSLWMFQSFTKRQGNLSVWVFQNLTKRQGNISVCVVGENARDYQLTDFWVTKSRTTVIYI